MQLGPIANISQALLGLRPRLVGGGDTAGVQQDAHATKQEQGGE